MKDSANPTHASFQQRVLPRRRPGQESRGSTVKLDSSFRWNDKLKIRFTEYLPKIFINLLSILLVFAVLFKIFSVWSNDPGGFQHIYGNSDLLYSSAIAHSLVYEHNHLNDWVYAAMPDFFPDIAINYLISLFTNNIIYNILFFALFQSLFLIGITAWAIRVITGEFFYFSICFTLATFLLSSELVGTNHHLAGDEMFSTMLMSCMHFSVVTISLLGLLLFFKILTTRNFLWTLFFYILITLTLASDLIIGFYLIIPLLITTPLSAVLGFVNKKKCIHLMCWLILTGITGSLLYQFSPLLYSRNHNLIHYDWWNIWNFIKVILFFGYVSTPITILWLSFVIWGPISLIKSYQKENLFLNSPLKYVNFFILFEVIMVLWTIPAYILTDNNLYLIQNNVYAGMRHLQTFILGPVLLGLPLLLYKHTLSWKFKKWIYGALALLVLAASQVNNPGINKTKLFSYYPPFIACIDHYAIQYHLHTGLLYADYWYHKPLNYFNHSGIKLILIHQQLGPAPFLTSLRDYEINDFDFILSRDHSQSFRHKIAQLGKPHMILTCPESTIYVYDHTALNFFPHLKDLRTALKRL